MTSVNSQDPRKPGQGKPLGERDELREGARGLTEQRLWVSLNLDDVKGRLQNGDCYLVTLQMGEL